MQKPFGNIILFDSNFEKLKCQIFKSIFQIGHKTQQIFYGREIGIHRDTQGAQQTKDVGRHKVVIRKMSHEIRTSFPCFDSKRRHHCGSLINSIACDLCFRDSTRNAQMHRAQMCYTCRSRNVQMHRSQMFYTCRSRNVQMHRSQMFYLCRSRNAQMHRSQRSNTHGP